MIYDSNKIERLLYESETALENALIYSPEDTELLETIQREINDYKAQLTQAEKEDQKEEWQFIHETAMELEAKNSDQVENGTLCRYTDGWRPLY